MLHAVIPAGGSGTRLWPLSRADRPKFLLPLAAAGRSLLQATVDRLAPLVPAERTLVVTGQALATAVTEQLPELPPPNVLAEPAPRDSCAAIGLAAAVIAQRDPDAVMGSFAADQLVQDQQRFRAAVRAAVAGAEQGWLMTVGMRPTRPETGFGYLRCGEPVGTGSGAGPGAASGLGLVRRVLEFKEKPDRELAVRFVESGDYLWNASMFIWPVAGFLNELARQQPALHAGLTRIAAAWDTLERERVLAEAWPELPRMAVEYAVLEDAASRGLVGTVPGDFGWTDVGDFRNLGDLHAADPTGNVVLPTGGPEGPEVQLLDSQGVVAVPGSGRLVSLLGLTDVVVVDTPDAVLVCARDRAQDVRQLVDQLKARGLTGYL